ncbi:SH3 domain-containing protein [Intestinimonas butyriciproducens]|uniref:SH3 domain-containing protein n=1 Tax=Intestinimonas butyriciproducens TaxID=1297617 RepID=UPI0018AB80D8|nr:SH3 domain-containing protein [Intestinimonas butyriciproducens]
MKKAIIYGMSLALILSMTACGGSNENAADKSQETSTPEVSQSMESSTPTPEQTTQTAPETTPTPESVSTPTQQKERLFTDCSETMYATTTVNVRSSYSTNSDKLGSLTKAQSVKCTGIGTGAAAGWSRIEFNGKVAYVSSDYLSATKPQVSVSKPSTGSSSGSTQTSKPSSKPSTGGSGGSSSSSSGGYSGSTAPVPPGGSGSPGGSNIGDLDMDELNDWMNDESQSGGWGSLEDSNHGFDPVDTQ